MKTSVGDITKSGHNKICEAPHLDRLESLRVSVTEVQRKFAVETCPDTNVKGMRPFTNLAILSKILPPEILDRTGSSPPKSFKNAYYKKSVCQIDIFHSIHFP